MAVVGVGGSVVDENIEPAVSLLHMLDDGIDLIHFADMAGEGGCLAASSVNFFCHTIAAVGAAAGDDDMGAMSGQQFSACFADPAAGACNQSDLAAQIE